MSALSLQHLNYDVPIKPGDVLASKFKYKIGHQQYQTNDNYKTILNDLNIKIFPGEFCAILGSSGCGKTSLMNIVTNKLYSKTYAGDVKLFEKQIGPWIKQKIGYVPQEDILYPLDTPREAIKFVADMKLKSHSNTVLLDNIIQSMGLEHCENTRIGNAANSGFEQSNVKTGISGGERRRVSIARELVRGAELLFLDECTSGLDVHTANRIVELLKNLTRNPYDLYTNPTSKNQNLTVVASLHQPSSMMWDLFDRIIVLAKGQIVYQGLTSQFFGDMKKLGISIPSRCNPADFLIEYINGDNAEEHINLLLQLLPERQTIDRDLTNVQKVDHNKQSWSQTIGAKPPLVPKFSAPIVNQKMPVQDNDIQTKLKHQELAFQKYRHIREQPTSDISSFIYQTFYEVTHHRAKYQHNYFYQFIRLLVRFQKFQFRKPDIYVRFLTQFTICALFAGSLFWRLDNTFLNLQNKVGALFFVQMCVAFAPGSDASVRFFINRQGYHREHSSGLYATFPFYIAMIIVDLFPYLIFVFYLSIISYYMIGFNDSFPRFLLFYVILIFTLLSNLAFVYALTAFFSNYITAQVITLTIVSIFIVFSGPYINSKSIPSYWKWMPWVSIFAYSFRALMYIIIDGTMINCVQGSFCPVTTGAQALEYYGLGGYSTLSSVAMAIGYSLLWMGSFFTIAFILLRYRRF